MKTVFSKLLLLVLALCMIVSSIAILASCSGDDKQNDTSGGEALDTGDILTDLPDKKFNEDFMIVCYDSGGEFMRETAEGDRVDYAIYMRNKAIEAKYGVEIKNKSMVYDQVPAWVSDILKANDDKSLDVVNNQSVYSSTIVLAGNALDMQTIPYMDFSKDWWLDRTLEDLTLNGKTYMALGDMHTTAIQYTYCMYYNKELCEKYNIPDMYTLAIKNGKWTYSEMLTYASNIRQDLNKDGRYNENDLYGLVTDAMSCANAFIWAWDNPIFTRSESSGELEFTFMSNKNKISKICSNLLSLYNLNDGVYVHSNASLFAKEQAVFQASVFGSAMSTLRDMDSEKWGVVPYPKYNGNQKNYITPVDGNHTALIVPKTTNQNKLEKIGVILEALNRLSSNGDNNLVTEYYDKGLKSKYLGDPKEAEAIELIMDSRMFDFGYLYLEFQSPAFWIQEMLREKTDSIDGTYKKHRPELQTAINSAYEAFGLTAPILP